MAFGGTNRGTVARDHQGRNLRVLLSLDDGYGIARGDSSSLLSPNNGLAIVRRKDGGGVVVKTSARRIPAWVIGDRMSIVLAISDPLMQDVVFCADSLSVSGDDRELSHDFLKIVKVNDDVCIGLAGICKDVSCLIRSLFPKPLVDWSAKTDEVPDTNYLDGRRITRPELGLLECAQEVTAFLRGSYGTSSRSPIDVFVGGIACGVKTLFQFFPEDKYSPRKANFALTWPPEEDFTPSSIFNDHNELGVFLTDQIGEAYRNPEGYCRKVIVQTSQHFSCVSNRAYMRRLTARFSLEGPLLWQ